MNDENKQVMIGQSPPGKCPFSIKTDDAKVLTIGFKAPYNSSEKPFETVVQDLTATQDFEIAREIIEPAIAALPRGSSIEDKLSTVLQNLADYAPHDSTEAKLCLQSTVLYSQGLRYLAEANISKRIDFSDFYMRSAVKLLRLHNETIEALSKYRRGCEQKVIVQHVNVTEGGQAVVNGHLVSGGMKR